MMMNYCKLYSLPAAMEHREPARDLHSKVRLRSTTIRSGEKTDAVDFACVDPRQLKLLTCSLTMTDGCRAHRLHI